jgi:hypothetical protein
MGAVTTPARAKRRRYIDNWQKQPAVKKAKSERQKERRKEKREAKRKAALAASAA